jgi:sensor histidine kinase YesM
VNIRCGIESGLVFLPRLTLQPLIENSIIHGLEPKEDGGKLRIKIFQRDQTVFIKIIDNGIGIPKDKLKDLMESGGNINTGHTTGIGITNVVSRLHNFFNGEEHFKIIAKPRFGTVISIDFPMKTEDESNV